MTEREELLRLPFDQYQRYRVAADLAARLGVRPGAQVGDVGGAPGRVEAFFPEHCTFVVDLAAEPHDRFVLGSGDRLPFASGAFDVVIALDTLEHVPVDRRAAFLAELRRVSDLVIVSAPFLGEEVLLAEQALGEFVTARLGEFPTLDEHAEHGLPDLDATVGELEHDGWVARTLPSGYLPRWLVGMILHHELLATGLPELPGLHAYYNATVSRLDCREPSYRHVVVASRTVPAAELDAAVDALRSTHSDEEGRVALRALASALFSERIGGALRSGDLAAAQERAELLRAEVADRDAHIIELRENLNVANGRIDALETRLTERILTKVRRKRR